MNHSALSYLPKMEKPTKQIKTFPKETRLLNDTTIEQMNSMRPDGTMISNWFPVTWVLHQQRKRTRIYHRFSNSNVRYYE